MEDVPHLGIPDADLRDIWGTLDTNCRGKCKRSDLVRCLGDPEMQALLTLTSKYGPTAEGEAAVQMLLQIPERTVRLIKEGAASVDTAGRVVKSNEVTHRPPSVCDVPPFLVVSQP